MGIIANLLSKMFTPQVFISALLMGALVGVSEYKRIKRENDNYAKKDPAKHMRRMSKNYNV